MKKIYIDGLGLVDGHFSGVGQYIYGILKGFDDILENSLPSENLFTVTVILPRDKVSRFKSFNFKHIGYKRLPIPFRYEAALWHRGKMPPIDIFCGKGIYIFPRFVDMPLLFNKSSALVVFDLSFELYRKFSDENNAKFLSKGVAESIKRTENVIAISHNAKEEIVDFYKIDPKKVTIATPATDQKYFYRRSSEEIEEVKRKYKISGDYILALSNLEPRKNLEALIEAYCKLPENMRENLSLLLVGVSGWKTDALFKDILAKVEAGYKIIRPSKYVSDKDKPAIISGAKMLVYPSHYEGFGMPPLEALACGVPVIAADNSSLPEVIGDAGVLINSADNGALVKQIEFFIKNNDKITKKSIIEGPLQAEKFNWSKSAQNILDKVIGGQK